MKTIATATRLLTRPAKLAAATALAGLFFAVSSNLAMAVTSDWATTHGGRMRVVALPPDESGKISAMLQIEPDEGWHTYWRAPGSGGIPPQVAVSPGGNVIFDGLQFPPPEVIAYDNLRDFGYEHPVSFPLKLEQVVTGVPSRLQLGAFVGVCSDICVPFQADFDLTIDITEQVNPIERSMIEMAVGTLAEAPSDDFKVTGHNLSVDGKSFEVAVKLPPDTDLASLLVVASDGTQAMEPIQISPTENDEISILFSPKYLIENKTLSGKKIGFVVVAGQRSMETDLVLQ